MSATLTPEEQAEIERQGNTALWSAEMKQGFFTEEEKALIREGLQRAAYEAARIARRRKYSAHPRMVHKTAEPGD